jgi:hypothetical protein
LEHSLPGFKGQACSEDKPSSDVPSSYLNRLAALLQLINPCLVLGNIVLFPLALARQKAELRLLSFFEAM